MPARLADLRRVLEATTGQRYAPAPVPPIANSDASQALRWETDSGPVFVKLANRERLVAFEAEAAGLAELATAGALRVPRAFGTGSTAQHAFIVLEWLEFGATTPVAEARLGEGLAMLHRSMAPQFGWHRANTIGRAPQSNDWSSSWPGYYVQQRLTPQLGYIARSRGDARLIGDVERLCECVPLFFTSYRPVPSLVHGDLWAGNWATDGGGEPVVFDPAVYFGDRETDLAMTRLFGGFGPAFYAAYQAAWPLDQAAGTRRTLYNLYHVLNHYHLFGGSYGVQARDMTTRLLAEIGH